MIISHSRRFIFLKSRKTAGSTLSHAFCDLCSDEDYFVGAKRRQNEDYMPKGNRKCVPASVVRDIVEHNIWSKYFKFVFVRNPWDLAVSRYYFDLERKRRLEYWQNLNKKIIKRRNITQQIIYFKRWLKRAKRNIWEGDELSQYTHIDGVLAVDFVGRFENLVSDVDSVCARLGVRRPVLGHEKKSFVARPHYSLYYDQESIDFVARKQKAAIEYFNYDFELPKEN